VGSVAGGLSPEELKNLPIQDVIGPDEEFKEFDAGRWCSRPYWTPHEAASLSLRVHPDMAELVPEWHSFKEEFAERVIVIQRAQELRDLPEKIRPIQFVVWASARGISLADELIGALGDTAKEAEELDRLRQENEALRRDAESMSRTIDELEKENGHLKRENEEPFPTARRSYWTMIAAMSQKHGYAVNKNTRAVSNIVDAAAGLGLSIDPSVVKRHLDEAWTLVSKDRS
jgi:hypothetical protein